jgi:hypothetical protein
MQHCYKINDKYILSFVILPDPLQNPVGMIFKSKNNTTRSGGVLLGIDAQNGISLKI